jgi:hypothetical protein
LRKVRGSQAERTHGARTDLRGVPGTPKLEKVYRGDNGIAWVDEMHTRAGCVRDDDGEQNGRVGAFELEQAETKAESPSIPTQVDAAMRPGHICPRL